MKSKRSNSNKSHNRERAVIARMASIFKVLSDPARLRIVLGLQRGEQYVQVMAAETGFSSSLVSHHLRHLRQLNLVICERRGRQAFYRLADSHVIALLAVAHDHATESMV